MHIFKTCISVMRSHSTYSGIWFGENMITLLGIIESKEKRDDVRIINMLSRLFQLFPDLRTFTVVIKCYTGCTCAF